ncbi:MAG: hypothetical protein LUD46_14255 [Parabacteroides sp.]|nr:hypothetical protein [Parabacteroides sp.]
MGGFEVVHLVDQGGGVNLVEGDALDHQVARLGVVLDVEAGDDAFKGDRASGDDGALGDFRSVTGNGAGIGAARIFFDIDRVDSRHDQRAGQLAGFRQGVGLHGEELGFGGFAQFQLVHVVLADGVGDEVDFLFTQAAQLDGGALVGSGGNELETVEFEFFHKEGRRGVERGIGILVEYVDREAVDGRLGYRGWEGTEVGIVGIAVGFREGYASFGKIFQGKAKGRLARFRFLAASAAFVSDFIVRTGSHQESCQYE